MQTDNIEGLDELSEKSRKQLKEQIERVQKEARKLRAQARRLRRAESAEVAQRNKLLAQLAASSKDWSQGVLQRGSDLASSGISLAGDQLRSGQRKALEYGGSLVQGASQLGNQASSNLSDWGGDTSNRLLKRSKDLSRSATNWSDDATYRLRKQGKHLAHKTSDWSEDTTYQLRKQGLSLWQNLADWYEEALYLLRRQRRKLSRNLAEQTEDTVHQLSRQKRHLSRSLAGRRDDATRQLRRQGRVLGRNLAGRRDDVTRQVRKQRDYLSERGGQLIEPMRGSRFWSIFGFVAGLLLAGSVTYWLVRRGMNKAVAEEEEAFELEVPEQLNGTARRPAGEVRAVGQGGTVVVSRPVTSAGPTTRFVGVLSSRRYYPIGSQPDAQDLVFFESEDDARAEGFTAAE
jgi:hypothetical protein